LATLWGIGFSETLYHLFERCPIGIYICMQTALIIISILVCPGIVMGIISSYRAGQRPHRDLYLMIKKFAHRK
jgi:ABC-type dipeptide/oligopeptide/nickel transport system permease subunit